MDIEALSEIMENNDNIIVPNEDNKESRKRTGSVRTNGPPRKRRGGKRSEALGNLPVAQLKKTGENFIQDIHCSEIANKLSKCRECRNVNHMPQSSSDIFCRFYAFRKLRYTKNGLVATAGFSDPLKDASADDIKLWMPNVENPPKDLDLAQARFILSQVGDQFCDLLQQEKATHDEFMNDSDSEDEEKIVAWKRVVEGIREMCDVCETTLFNYHWACHKCGFVVCIDCYKARKNGEIKIWDDGGRDRDNFHWFKCGHHRHEPHDLMLSQIIAGDSLQTLGRLIHEVRAKWGIPQHCGCPMSKKAAPPDQYLLCRKLLGQAGANVDDRYLNVPQPNGNDHRTADAVNAVALYNSNDRKAAVEPDDDLFNMDDDLGSDASSSDDEHDADFRNFLTSGASSKSEQPAASPEPEPVAADIPLEQNLMENAILPEQNPNGIENVVEEVEPESKIEGRRSRRYIPIRIMTLAASQKLYPSVPHTWLCEGKLLRLLDPLNTGNTSIFQENWKRGQPVIVSEVSSCLQMDLWRPEAFSRDFGEDANDLINCMTGTLVPNQPMKRFWDGFDYVQKRIKDENGDPMLLKLKDWPPGEDFAEILPTRFNDLMRCLPLGDYTKRDGKFNLASRLPDIFVKPDLGPKMYNAYGSALHPTKGTTNLHLDISDAVNVMVYVGIPKDTGTDDLHIREAYRAIDEAGCDILTRRRVREGNELPGALWHIYAPRDANKIRDLLNKISIERGERLEPNHDPIHDQSWYLDGELRKRLYDDYGVEGYPIAQCLGDAVFIPAGAPHQVRNLHNCVKVAEDFVSPENVSQCFHLTHEFRALSDTHANHEDKLQIKNIIYHAVKDSVARLTHIFNQHTVETIVTEKDPVQVQSNESSH